MDTSGLYDCPLFTELEDLLVTPTFYDDDTFASEKDATAVPVFGGTADVATVTAQAWDETPTYVGDSTGQVLATVSVFADVYQTTEAPTLPDSYDDGDIFKLLSSCAVGAAAEEEGGILLPCYVEESSIVFRRDDASSVVDGSSSGDATSIADGSSSFSSYESDCDSSCNGKVKSTKRGSKSRTKPYDSLPKEKKEKKKLQNKNAATRYRLKKKVEDVILLTEEQCLLERNKQLKDRVAELQQEIDLLKDLMQDICCSSMA